MKTKYYIFLLILLVSIGLLLICSSMTANYPEEDIRIFKNTKAWGLAKAISEEDIEQIEEMLEKNSEYINTRDKLYGYTLLHWSVGMQKYDSTLILLKLGADPNITDKTKNTTPLFTAAGPSWGDSDDNINSKFVEILLQYNAKPNIARHSENKQDGLTEGFTPLMYATSLEKVIALVEGGADINQRMDDGSTAALASLVSREVNIAHYLIVEKKADISLPLVSMLIKEDAPKIIYPIEFLRHWNFKLYSEEYYLKMQIVDEFMNQGYNYWETSIPEIMIKNIKKQYPDSWEEYIKKY